MYMKKKKTFSTLCSLLLTLSLMPIAAAAQPITRQVERTADDFKPVLRFAVISDHAHFQGQKPSRVQQHLPQNHENAV